MAIKLSYMICDIFINMGLFVKIPKKCDEIEISKKSEYFDSKIQHDEKKFKIYKRSHDKRRRIKYDTISIVMIRRFAGISQN